MLRLRAKEEKPSLIKNPYKKEFERHYSWNAVGVIWFILFFFLGIVAYDLYRSESGLPFETALLLALPLLLVLITFFLARWEAVFLIIVATSLAVMLRLGSASWPFLIFFWFGGSTAPMFHICKEWERAIVLRLGKFRKVKGPGLFLLLPFLDSIAKKVDLRIRVTDFAAETTLTRDSVPITVDALCFWLVWDAEKAVLEVENYLEAVVLSAQTALRAAISANDLSTLLFDGGKIEEEVRNQVDRKTTDWGITIQHIEITEIEIPQELQKAMSYVAQAEREKKARILLSEAEKEVALRLEEAAKVYETNPTALKLKKLSVIGEGFKNGGAMVLVPSGLPEELGEDKVFGLKALNEVRSTKSPGNKK